MTLEQVRPHPFGFKRNLVQKKILTKPYKKNQKMFLYPNEDAPSNKRLGTSSFFLILIQFHCVLSCEGKFLIEVSQISRDFIFIIR